MNEVISDQLDQASALEQMASEMRVKQIQVEANKPIPTSEFCLWCASKTKNGRRFCNRDCCSYWEKYGGQ